MSEYQLQIKQVVDYPRCRIYRQFVQSLITDQGIRTGGGSGLFYFEETVCGVMPAFPPVPLRHAELFLSAQRAAADLF